VRRRLEQAGFDVADGLDRIGKDDISFLLKFQYKTQLLGAAVRAHSNILCMFLTHLSCFRMLNCNSTLSSTSI
jgi:hypothetical protein